ncbi:hypothetical protein Hdeb2414_s0004g00120481 [Helianthus debilis subsp. tardiflorus]
MTLSSLVQKKKKRNPNSLKFSRHHPFIQIQRAGHPPPLIHRLHPPSVIHRRSTTPASTPVIHHACIHRQSSTAAHPPSVIRRNLKVCSNEVNLDELTEDIMSLDISGESNASNSMNTSKVTTPNASSSVAKKQ